MVRGVANVWVPVEDIERALDFYRNTLGFSVIKRDGPWAEVDANGLNIGLNGREPQGARAGGGPVVTFQPEVGLEAAVEELKGKGLEFAAGISEHEWGVLLRSRTARATSSSSTSRQAVDPQVQNDVEGMQSR
jgi:catechol 2,3-dioxygenase-like lactoylglutathione lyase family enzyme